MGGAGADTMYGGAGADTFRFGMENIEGRAAGTPDTAGDIIMDFQDRADRLDFGALHVTNLHTEYRAGSTVVVWGTGEITLQGVQHLHGYNFIM